MISIRKKFASMVRASRKARELTQEQLAVMAECSNDSISNIERARSSPSLEIVASLVKVLKLDPVALFSVDRRADGLSDARMAQEEHLLKLAEALDDQNLAILLKIADVLARE